MVLLWIILKALASAAILVLFIIIAILFVPVRYRLNTGYEEKLSVYVKAQWLLRIFTFIYDTEAQPSFRIKIFGRISGHKHKFSRARKGRLVKGDSDSNIDKPEERKQKKEKITKKPADEKVSGDAGKRDIKGIWLKVKDYPYKEALVKKTWLFLKRTLRALSPRRAYAECRFGFDDPGATGIMLGAAHAALGTANLYKYIDVSAVFDRKYLYLKCRAEGSVSVWSLLWPLAAYALCRPVWVLWKPYIFRRRLKG